MYKGIFASENNCRLHKEGGRTKSEFKPRTIHTYNWCCSTLIYRVNRFSDIDLTGSYLVNFLKPEAILLARMAGLEWWFVDPVPSCCHTIFDL